MHDTYEHNEINELQQQAINWLVLLRSGDMHDDQLHGFADWLAEDATHAEAFAEAEKLLDEMGAALSFPDLNTDQPTPKLEASNHPPTAKNLAATVSYWGRMSVSVTAIAAILLLFIQIIAPNPQFWMNNFLSDHYTNIGEIRELQLADGSSILLNANTAISVHYSATHRLVNLHHGQARFTVKADSLRPFVVNSGHISTQAMGTQFDIFYRNEKDIRITVQEHAVLTQMLEHNSQNSDPLERVFIEAGQQLQVVSKNQLPTPVNIPLEHTTAWQQGRLIINDQALSEVLEELQRYHDKRIFVSPDDINELHISGVFHLDDMNNIIHSLCQALELQSTQLTPWWILLHR